MYLAAASLVCPVGLNARSACAAMRAGVAGFTELPYFDKQHEPVMGAAVPGLDFELTRKSRLLRMLVAALKDLLDGHPGARSERVPLLLGLAEPERPGVTTEFADSFQISLQDELKARFHPRLSKVLPRGHVSVFEGLRAARDLLEDREVPACVVAAVDSKINATTSHWLDGQGRLKTESNSNGLIPGEAAGAVVVQRAAPKEGVAVRVTGLGFATEKVPVMSEEPFLGLGLAQATRQALSEAGRRLNEMDFRLSDVTGESYGFKEQALTLSRVLRQGPSALPLWHCADAIGDTGAAAGVCQLVRASEAFRQGYAPGDKVICFASSMFGERAVAILERTGTAPSRVDSAKVERART